MILSIPYFLFGLNSSFVYIYLLCILTGLAGSAMGFFLAALWPDNAQISVLFGPLVLATLPNVFGGIFKPLPEIWVGFRWLSFVTPAAFFMPVAMWLEFEDTKLNPTKTSTEQQQAYKAAIVPYLESRNAKGEFVLRNVLVCFALVGLYRAGAWGLLMWKSRTMY